MKLSKRTISILKNFSLINQNILFRKGDVISTISESSNQYAIAKLEEYIPKEFAIYDLNKFLAILNLMNQPDIEITESDLIIRDESSETIFRLASRNTILASPDEEIVVDSPLIQFNITEEQLSLCRKAMSVLSTPEISFIGENGKIKIKTKDSEQAIGDSYSISIGHTSKNFECTIKAEHMTMLSGNYEVSISDGVAVFRTEQDSLYVEYYIATN